MGTLPFISMDLRSIGWFRIALGFIILADQGANGGAKVDHGSGGMVPLRRSKTLPVWQPFPVVGRAGGFTPWSCIARSVWRAGTG